jgi:hypothetical protein
MNALDYKTTDHHWGGSRSRFVPALFKVENKSGTKVDQTKEQKVNNLEV